MNAIRFSVTIKVREYDAWKKVFDAHNLFRKERGELSHQIFRADNDPNRVLLLFEWDSIERAERFYGSEEIKRVMKEAGVLEKPERYFLSAYSFESNCSFLNVSILWNYELIFSKHVQGRFFISCL